jgi:hypothetical protein
MSSSHSYSVSFSASLCITAEMTHIDTLLDSYSRRQSDGHIAGLSSLCNQMDQYLPNEWQLGALLLCTDPMPDQPSQAAFKDAMSVASTLCFLPLSLPLLQNTVRWCSVSTWWTTWRVNLQRDTLIEPARRMLKKGVEIDTPIA